MNFRETQMEKRLIAFRERLAKHQKSKKPPEEIQTPQIKTNKEIETLISSKYANCSKELQEAINAEKYNGKKIIEAMTLEDAKEILNNFPKEDFTDLSTEGMHQDPDNPDVVLGVWEELPEKINMPTMEDWNNVFFAIAKINNGENQIKWKESGSSNPENLEIKPGELFDLIIKNLNLNFNGYRYTDGSYFSQGSLAFYWSASERSSAYARLLTLLTSNGLLWHYTDKAYGFSVRCFKDQK